jgi:hypothetical protein
MNMITNTLPGADFTAIYGLGRLRAGHPAEGTFVSQIVDTRIDNPNFESIDWYTVLPPFEYTNAAVRLKVRGGNQSNLADAPDWADVSFATPGFDPLIDGKRYVQIQATLTPGEVSGTLETETPILRDFTLRWVGERRFVTDLSGIFATGPDHGIYEVLINGEHLVQGITTKLTVFKDVNLGRGRQKTLEASAFMEVVPRNRR